MAYKGKWGHPGAESRLEENGWYIGLRPFNCTDGTSCWQYKVAKNLFSFTDPQTSYFGWTSKVTPRKRKEFQTRDEALAAARDKIADYARKGL